MIKLTTALLFAVLANAAQAATYVIPVYASTSYPTSSWDSILIATNTTDAPVTVRLERIAYVEKAPCILCLQETEWQVPPRTSIGLGVAPDSSVGAFAATLELSATAPLHLTHVIRHRRDGAVTEQSMPVLEAWEAAGSAIIPGVFLGDGYRANLFVTNPGPATLHLTYFMLDRAFNEHSIEVPPGVTMRVQVLAPLCDFGEHCGSGSGPVGPHMLTIEADAPYAAIVSNITPSDDATTLAPAPRSSRCD